MSDDKPRRKDHEHKYKMNLILSKTTKNKNCLEWTGNYFRRKSGKLSYPYMYFKNKVWRGNRLVWFLLNGEIPKKGLILHSCDNIKCINPEHLSLGSYADNNRQMAERGRCAGSKKTHCPHGHSYSGQNLRYDKDKKRFCRSCSFYRNNKMPITRKNVYAT